MDYSPEIPYRNPCSGHFPPDFRSCEISPTAVMKRPRSYGEDLDEDWGRREQDLDRHRRFYHGRNGSYDDDREVSRPSRKRSEHESEGLDRRKGFGFDRYRDGSDRSGSISSPRSSISSPRSVYCGERVHRSESLSASRREFETGSRLERDRLRREESVSAWRRSVIGKDSDEDLRVFGVNSGRGGRIGYEDRGSVRSPPGSRDAGKSSPPRSKDSGSEQSKSVELKKSGEACGDGSSSSSSEMEEGELEPDPEPEPESNPVNGVEQPECSNGAENDLGKEMKSLDEEKLEIDEKGISDEKHEGVMVESAIDKKLNHEDDGAVNKLGEKEENAGEECALLPSPSHETKRDRGHGGLNEETGLEKQSSSEIASRDQKDIDLEDDAEDDSLHVDMEVAEENSTPNVTLGFITDKLNENCKDKGKSVVVSPSNEGNSSDDGGWIERDYLSARGNDMEGPSSRGFELFFHSHAIKAEKANQSVGNLKDDTKLAMEPLELSLGLPNVLLALDSHDPKQAPKSQSCAPNSPSHGRSVQSLPTTFLTDSDGFTASISFSASEQFVHNTSCSLNQNSFENYEHSVGSHPIFKGVDQVPQGSSWQGQSANELKRKEVPSFQRILQNGNVALHAPQAPQGLVNGNSMQGHRYLKLSEVSNGIPNGLDRQLTLQRQLSGQLRQDEARSPSHSVGSRETRSEHSMDKKVMRERNGGGLFRTAQREMEQLLLNGIGVSVSIVTQIVSEPIQIMARTVQEMTEQSIACIKESVCEIIDKKEKQGQLCAFQEFLRRRADLTLETLTNCNRTQLEILVALKTGLRDFLWQTNSISSSDLVQIFLNLKCRNLACRSILPVDECDCKVCVKKNGFCSACMCLVCLKFDMASNTCSWVGCDVCLHWCHTDCGLRNSHIRNGRSASGSQETTEMQFHCVACSHPSEMFGFVREVFKTFAKDWTAETLSKELGYVKRIFFASDDDVRGKKMHKVAAQMLEKLETGSNLSEVFNCIMTCFTEGDSKFGNNPSTSMVKDLPNKKIGEGSNGMVGPSQDAIWLRSTFVEKAPLIKNTSGVASLDWERVGRQTEVRELQLNVEKKPVVDELESIVRIKQAEAKMFQTRADDARREAEGLKRIAIAKNEKIDVEYASRIAKLCLVETKEKCRQKLEELHTLEKAHCEYFNMKVRMEADIKDLLLQVETTKRNLST